MANEKDRFSLPSFFFLVFIISWIGAIPVILSSYGKSVPGPLKILQVFMLFGPGIAACIAAWINDGWNGVKHLLRAFLIWRVHFGWYLLALLVPPIVYAFSVILSNITGLTTIVLPAFAQILSNFFTTLGVYLVLNTEEIAWRGYVLPRMTQRFGIFAATVALALIWTVFHLPLFWIKGGHPAGYSFWLFTVMVLSISLLFSAAYFGALGSLLIVHLLHQTLNSAVEAIPVYPRAVNSVAPICLATAMFFVIGIILLAMVQKKIRGRSETRPSE